MTDGRIPGTSKLAENSANQTGKSLWSVFASQSKLVNEPPMAKQEIKQVPMLQLKSNFARDRTVSIGDFHIPFNSKGEASVPSHYKEAVDLEMSRRPGRYQWVSDQPIVSPEIEVISPPEQVEETFSLEQEIEEVLELEEAPEADVKPEPKPRTIKKAAKTAKKK